MKLRPLLLCAALSVAACDDKALPEGPKPPAGLTRQQAAAALARVGDKTITVGDFAAALERMDDIARVRFQTPQKRKELLQEMIDTELLAQEARRRGLDVDPTVRAGVRQVLRDVMLAKARENLPTPAEISAGDVAAFYQAHRADFEEPERRRVAAIVLGDPVVADEVLAKVKKIHKPQEWGDLYYQSSMDAPKEREASAPPDLAGDLGLCGPPGSERSKNERIPESVQRAVFELAKVGDVADKAAKVPGSAPAGDKYYIVRMTGMSKGHTRTLFEADRAIRVAILQERVREREKKLEAELRQRFQVRVDDQALSTVSLPAGASSETTPASTP